MQLYYFINNTQKFIAYEKKHIIEETLIEISKQLIKNKLTFYRRNYMFTTFMVPLFIFITTKETFSKIHFSFNGKRLLCPCYYIYNKSSFK